MSKLFSLLRATMSGGIQLFNYRANKKEQSGRAVPYLLAIMVGVMMLFSAVALAAGLKEEGRPQVLLSMYTITTTIIIVLEGTYKSGDLLFRPRDNDTLLAMPIKRSTIVLARMIKFYVFEMAYCLIFLLPAIIAYALNVEVGATFCLVAITMLILVPVIPIVVSCVVGLITSAFSSRFRHKTFWQVILSFVFLFVMAILVLKLNVASDFDGHSIIALSDKLTEFYYPAAVFYRLATTFDIWQYLSFIALNLAVIALAVILISRFYFSIVTRMDVTKLAKNNRNDYKFVRHGQTLAIVRKEINRYFSTPVLLMNTAIGLVLFLVAVGALCFKFEDVVNYLISSTEEFPLTTDEAQMYLPSIAFILVAFASLMTFITATMISLEGRAFNLLKTMPISGVKVIMTKVLAAMLLIVPVTLAGCIVMFARFQFGVLEMLLVLIAVIAMPFVTEMIGILINLKYARFDSENDAVVVKQSASVMTATFIGLGMVLLTVGLTIAIVLLAGQTVGLLIIDAVYVIVALFLYLAIVTRGDGKYLKLAA